MTDFLSSLKADLLDRRLLPILALVGVGLAAAVGYAVLGGGSSSPSPAVVAPATPVGAGAAGISVTQSPANSDQPVAETTSGASHQRQGPSRNPFVPLPGPAKAASSAAATTPSGAATAGASTTGSGSKPSTPSGEPTPATPSKPSAPAKPTTVYHVAVLFGVVPAGMLPAEAQLTPYENLKLLRPLPSAKQPLVVFRGVTSGGKSATFTLVGEAILHGAAACLPRASQCQAIDLKPSQSEQLEYLAPNGEVVTYELRVVSIVAGKASAAGVKTVLRSESKAGRELLRRAGLVAVPGLHYSQVGVLAFAAHRAFGAHAARRHSHH